MARLGALTPPGSGDGYQGSVQSHLARPLRNAATGALLLGLASSAAAQAQPADAAPDVPNRDPQTTATWF